MRGRFATGGFPALRALSKVKNAGAPSPSAGVCSWLGESSSVLGASGAPSSEHCPLRPRDRIHSSIDSSGHRQGQGQTFAVRHLNSASALEDCSVNGQAVPQVDIEGLVGEERNCISSRIRHMVQAEIPSLARIAEYFFKPGVEGKRVRSSALLLVASSLSSSGEPGPELLTPDLRPYDHFPGEVRRRQQRLAEITEMIHVASLLHDDVLDDAETRRGLNAVNKVFGTKAAILGGDFLLARASVALASLKNTQVVALIATVIENLVTGEMMQSKCSQEERLSLDYYYQKTYLKTASLIANSCKSVALLGDHNQQVAQLAYDYGYHLGMSFQLIDDVLDFVGSSSSLGKPTLSDLKSGIATAPVLLASLEQPQLIDLTLRKFKYEGDVEMAARLVAETEGIKKTVEVAERHSRLAMKAVDNFPEAQTKHAQQSMLGLKFLAQSVTTRQK